MQESAVMQSLSLSLIVMLSHSCSCFGRPQGAGCDREAGANFCLSRRACQVSGSLDKDDV